MKNYFKNPSMHNWIYNFKNSILGYGLYSILIIAFAVSFLNCVSPTFLGTPAPLWSNLFVGVSVLVSRLFIAQKENQSGPQANWKSLSHIVNNKRIHLFIFVFTVSPVIVKAVSITDLDEYLSPLFFGYWTCGFAFLIFTSLFKLFAPRVYSFDSFEHFKQHSGSIIDLRTDAQKALRNLNSRENADRLYPDEKHFLTEDKLILTKIIESKNVDLADAYIVLRERLAFYAQLPRYFISLFLLIPSLLFPILFILNVNLVIDSGQDVFESGKPLLSSFFQK